MQKKKTKCIGLVFGGVSNEHDVSVNSAKNIYKAFLSFKKDDYVVKAFYLNRSGNWFDNQISESILNDVRSGYSKIEENYTPKNNNFLENININDIDVWFPIIHGANGEDGTIQGFLKMTQKPFIGSGILGSALGMDKIAMKQVLSHLDIPQVKYLSINLNIDSPEKNLQEFSNQILQNLSFPVFIKPANSGSSLGISKVKNKHEIYDALLKASKIDTRIIAEEGYEVRELECGVIGKSELITSEIGEVRYETDWYNYESKYSINNNQIIIPAKVDIEIEEKIKNLTIKSCKALNIFGFARADFFFEEKTNKVFLNEINTIPGFTNKSMFPMLWKASGLEIDQLVAKLVDIAIDS